MKSPIGSCEKDQCFVHGSVRVWGLYILGLGAKVGKLVLFAMSYKSLLYPQS